MCFNKENRVPGQGCILSQALQGLLENVSQKKIFISEYPVVHVNSSTFFPQNLFPFHVCS